MGGLKTAVPIDEFRGDPKTKISLITRTLTIEYFF